MNTYYFAVTKGKKTGVFEGWEACREVVYGDDTARYHRFNTPEEAFEYMGEKSEIIRSKPASTGVTPIDNWAQKGDNVPMKMAHRLPQDDEMAFGPQAELKIERRQRYMERPDGRKIKMPASARDVFNTNLKYRIMVHSYMTKPSFGDFNFMKDWNDDIPMPSATMEGIMLSETDNMVLMDLADKNGRTWCGWVARKAIIAEEEVKLFEAHRQDGSGTGKKTGPKLRVEVMMSRTGKYILRMTKTDFNLFLSMEFEEFVRDRYGKIKDGCFYLQAEHLEDVLNNFDDKCAITVENPDGYKIEDEFHYEPIMLDENYPAFEYKTKPFRHQEEAYAFGMSRRNVLIADSQGLGKSFEAIAIAEGKKKQFGYKHCLVVCGVNTLKWNWMEEIKQHSHESARILGFKRKNVGSNADKVKDVKNLDKIEEYFIITNVESLRNKDLFKAIKEQCDEGNISMVIVDEFHKCKNTKSKQGKSLMDVNATDKIALTGTPILNRPTELYAVFKWLGYEHHSASTFTNFFTKKVGVGYDAKISYRHMDIMQDNLSKIMLRRTKEDCLDLPEKTYVDEYIELMPNQKKLYNDVAEELIQNIGEIELSGNPLSKMTRLRQVTGNTEVLDGVIKESGKFERMEDLVEEYAANGEKVIIFSIWAEMVKLAEERLAKYDPLVIMGDVDARERLDKVKKFQSDPDTTVIIGTIGAMGTGLTLTAASAVIFLDEPWTNADKEQAVDRAHRIGTNHKVTIHTLLCKETIDEKIHYIIETKKGISDILVDRKEDNRSIARFLLGLDKEISPEALGIA